MKLPQKKQKTEINSILKAARNNDLEPVKNFLQPDSEEEIDYSNPSIIHKVFQRER